MTRRTVLKDIPDGARELSYRKGNILYQLLYYVSVIAVAIGFVYLLNELFGIEDQPDGFLFLPVLIGMNLHHIKFKRVFKDSENYYVSDRWNLQHRVPNERIVFIEDVQIFSKVKKLTFRNYEDKSVSLFFYQA